jgi:hypothetical protein
MAKHKYFRRMLTLPLIFAFIALSLYAQATIGAQAANPSLVTEELDFAIGDSIDNSGNKYIGYAGRLPTVLTLVNDDGEVSVALCNEKTKTTFVYEYTSGAKLKTILKFQNELSILGAFTKDRDGNYYFFYAEPQGKSTENMAMVKYDKAGNKLAVYKLKAHAENSMDGVRTPFDAGTCRLEISGGLLAVYFARLMFNGHQASYGFVLDCGTFERVDSGATTNDKEAGRKIMPYVSHSFNQFIVPVEDGFLFADHGDAYPRSFTFARWQLRDRTKRINSFTFTGSTGQNATFAEMGGVAKTATGFIFAGTYGNGASNPRNLFIQTLDNELSAINNPVYLTSYTKQDGHAAHPKITALDEGRYLLMWELMEFSAQSANQIISTPTGYKSTHFMIIDETGKTLAGPKAFPEGVRLNMNDTLRYNNTNGRVYWSTNIGGKSFGLWTFNPGAEINYKVDASLFNKSETADPEHFKYSVQSKTGAAETITITKYTGPINNLIIPDKINGLPVTSIGKDAFTYSSITSVVIPDTVTTIEDQAFWYSSIKTLTIPASVMSIGKQAFSYCKSLETVTLPKNIKTIKDFAFLGCENLVKVIIDRNSDMQLGYNVFDKCPKLDPESLKIINSF